MKRISKIELFQQLHIFWLKQTLQCIYIGPTQQTQDIDTMLIQRWPTVFDADPSLNQHCVNVLCLPSTDLTGEG